MRRVEGAEVLGRVVAGSAILLLMAAAAGAAAGVRWNLSPSLPPGFYLLRPGQRAEVGDAVLFCLAEPLGRMARERGYLRHGGCAGGASAIGKLVVAQSGDTIDHSPARVRIGRVLSRTRVAPLSGTAHESRTDLFDAAGRPLPHHEFGLTVLEDGELWVMSARHPRSFDSRYFGAVPASAVLGVLQPIWTR